MRIPFNDLRCTVAERHSNEHGFRFSLCNEIIKNELSSSHGRPSAGVIAESVQEIENRIFFYGVGIVTGRSVHVEIPVVANDGGSIVMMMDGAVGNIIELPRHRIWSGHIGLTLRVQKIVFDDRVGRIEHVDAVHIKRISVDVGCKWACRYRPETISILLHCDCLCAFPRKQYLLRIRSAKPESDAVVGVDFRRNDQLGLTFKGEEHTQERDEKQLSLFHDSGLLWL